MRCNLCGLPMDGTAYVLARVSTDRRAMVLDCCSPCLESVIGLAQLRRLVASMSHGGFTVQYLPGFDPSDLPGEARPRR